MGLFKLRFLYLILLCTSIQVNANYYKFLYVSEAYVYDEVNDFCSNPPVSFEGQGFYQNSDRDDLEVGGVYLQKFNGDRYFFLILEVHSGTLNGGYYLNGFEGPAYCNIKNLAGGSFPMYSSSSLSDENYVFTRSYQVPLNNSSEITNVGDVIESVTYYDGLGRPMQQVNIRASDDYRDVLTHIGYDAYGRQDKDWLPMENTSAAYGTYRGDVSGATNTFYRNKFPDDISSSTSQQNAYSQKEFEASPLIRVLKQGAPGNAWRLDNGNHQGLITFDYDTNTDTEVKIYNVSLTSDYTPTLTGGSSYYDSGELYKTVTRDENHDGGTSKNRTTEEFKDKQGRVVLKRTYGDSDVDLNGAIGSNEQGIAHDTYYVYDDFGNLTYVLPPKAEATGGKPNSNELSRLCYQYKYDHRNRLIEKKIPGKGWEYIVYNKLDQPCMTQDANLDAENKWLFTKYDVFGRITYTGYWSGNETRINLQTVFDNAVDQYETRSATANTYSGDQVFYSNIAKPNGVAGVYTINYYDSYLPSGAQGKVTLPFKTTYNDTLTTNVKTLPTVSRVRVLTTNDWITTTTGYDQKGRAIWVNTVNEYLNTNETVEMKLDFTGKVLQSKTIHTKQNLSLTIETEDFFTYDHMGRLEKHTQKINQGNEELIAFNEYDELGQLKKKKVGNTEASPLQEIDYAYNIRGWLKSINNPDVIDAEKLFSFKLNYNTTEMGISGVNPLYNGNISETIWRTANTEPAGNRKRGYAYQYDALNRIKSGAFRRANSSGTSFSEQSSHFNVSNLVYDLNGNIKKLKRRGPTNSSASSFGDMDVLTYSYESTSNKLIKVLDDGNGTYGFRDGSDTSIEYTYDANGNMVTDLNKGIGNIDYNYLNLPDAINVTSNVGDGIGDITYIYDATGVKLEKTAPGNVTQYAGNYIYKNDALEFFNQPEGYVEKVGADFKYVYQYKDHLGNIRLSYQDKNGDGDIDLNTDISNEIVEEKNYYPFGLEHKGYNDAQSEEFNYKQYQGQELTEDLGLNWHEWKYRMSDPAIGRFISIDPLAEDYSYQSPYNFAENRVIDGFELEGLEWVDTDDGWVYEGYDYGPQPAEAGAIGVAPEGSSPVAAWSGPAPVPFIGDALYVGGPDGTVESFNANSSGMVELPSSGTEQTGTGTNGTYSIDGHTVFGYFNRNDVSGAVEDQFGTPSDIANMINAITEFNENGLRNDLVQIGDMRSPTNGRVNMTSTATHHGAAGSFDIRLLGENGSLPAGSTVNSPNFSAARSQQFINALGNNGFTRMFIGPNALPNLENSGTLRILDGGTGHNNHYHVDR